jgi:hypothetical protein
MMEDLEILIPTGLAIAGFMLAVEGSAWFLLITLVAVAYILIKDAQYDRNRDQD